MNVSRSNFATAIAFILCSREVMAAEALPNADSVAIPPAAIETCEVDPKRIIGEAIRKGYAFNAKGDSGEPNCSIEEGGTILIVSAKNSADGSCIFSIFSPPTGKQLSVVRAAIRSASDGKVSYIQRNSDHTQGLSLVLSAKRGNTIQFRITKIELDSINNKCSAPALEGAL